MESARLAQIPFFADLADADLAEIASVATEVDASEGEQLATAGDFGHALYAIESGTADVVADGDHIRSLGPGDVFGEIAVLSAGRRTASVKATSPMTLVALFKRDVWALEQRAPEVVARLRGLITDRLG